MFLLVSLLVYGGLVAWLTDRIDGTTPEWAFTAGHLAIAAAINAHLLAVARRRELSLLASAPLALLLLNHIYFTINGLKYFSPILLYPQFDLDLRTQFLGSAAGAGVLFLGALVLGRQRGPRTTTVRAWLERHWRDVRALMLVCVLGSIAAKAALIALGYGSTYTDTQFHEHQVRSYGDYFILLANDTLGTLGLLLGFVYLMRPASWDRPRPLTALIALLGVLVQFAYALFYLKARMILLVSAVSFALACEVVSRRRGERVLQALLLVLPALSLVGVQLTLWIGRVNVPEEMGLRFVIGAVNRRADITDFATALIVRSGGEAFDPRIVWTAFLNAIPRFFFTDKQALVGDVYSDIVEGKLGWPPGTGPNMATDYQDSMFSAGVMSFGPLGFILVPLVLVWGFGAISRFLERRFRGLGYGLTLIPLALVAMHIEVEWATIPLNMRQAISMTVICLGLVWLARTVRHVLVVATHPPPASASAGEQHA